MILLFKISSCKSYAKSIIFIGELLKDFGKVHKCSSAQYCSKNNYEGCIFAIKTIDCDITDFVGKFYMNTMRIDTVPQSTKLEINSSTSADNNNLAFPPAFVWIIF